MRKTQKIHVIVVITMQNCLQVHIQTKLYNKNSESREQAAFYNRCWSHMSNICKCCVCQDNLCTSAPVHVCARAGMPVENRFFFWGQDKDRESCHVALFSHRDPEDSVTQHSQQPWVWTVKMPPLATERPSAQRCQNTMCLSEAASLFSLLQSGTFIGL